MKIVIKLNADEALKLISVRKKDEKNQEDMHKALSWVINCLVNGNDGPMPLEAIDISRLYDC